MVFFVFFIKFYTIFFVLFFVFIFFRKKKIPKSIVIINFLIIAGFWYLEYVVDEGKLSFLAEENVSSGELKNDPDKMGMGNGLGWLYNRFILSGIFFFIQVIFFIVFERNYTLMNQKQKVKQPGQLL